MIYVVCSERAYEPDDDERVWTLSEHPEKEGWETDSGASGYGLSRQKALYYAKCINEYPKLVARIKELEPR